MDDRRTRSLIRDEGRLRAALDEHDKRRFDVDTALTVKYRVEDLLETIGMIIQDQDFWDRLADINRPPSSQQLERVRQLDPVACAALLQAAGYGSPPPPPVEELVDDTITALIIAVEAPTGSNMDKVSGAKWQLQTLVMRVRRQINEPLAPELASCVLRSCARSVVRAARWLIPRLVGATAGAFVEAHAPSTGLGVVAWHSLERTAEDLGELTTEMVIGDPSPAPDAVATDEPAWTEIDPLSVHIAALSDRLHAVSGLNSWTVSMSTEEFRQIIRESLRHQVRIIELIHDSSRETNRLVRPLQAICDALDSLSSTIYPDYNSSTTAEIALNEVARLREVLTQEAEPYPEKSTQKTPRPSWDEITSVLRQNHPGPSAPPPVMPA
jgi:hypothetical protein